MQKKPTFSRQLSRLLAWLTLASCETPVLPTMPVVIEVESDPGAALADVPITLAGSSIGRSDHAGRATLVLSGVAGGIAELSVRCPLGFHARDVAVNVALRPAASSVAPPVYNVRCAPQFRNVVLSVRADGGRGLPVRYLGREIARTDDAGAAHAVIRAAPGERVEVVLDTTARAHAQLRPQRPVFHLVVPDRDDVVLFDQNFAVHRPARRNARRHRLEHVGPVHF